MNSAARSEALVPKALELFNYEKRSNSFANANPVLVIDKLHPVIVCFSFVINVFYFSM